MFNIHKLLVVLMTVSLGLGICIPTAQAAILGGDNWNELVEAAPGFTFAEGNTGGLAYTDPSSGITINGESGAVPTIGQPGTAWGFMPGTTNTVLTPEATPALNDSVFLRYLTSRDSNEIRWGGASFTDGGEISAGAHEILYVGTAEADRGFFGFHDQTDFQNGSPEFPTNLTASAVPFNANQVYFVVAEIDMVNDKARLWVDPAFGATAPTPDLEIDFTITGNKLDDVPGEDFSGKIGSIRLKTSTLPNFETNDKYMTADEIVIGTTWGDVVPAPPSANFDGDTDVDGHDFLIWQRGFGGPGVLATGDANGDLVVDGVDLGIWQGQFGTTGLLSAASATTVPEPGALSLATLASGLACLVRRKRSLAF